MAAYTVNHRYTAFRDGTRFGPYEPGTTVDLEPADAAWVNRDSPGCLTAADSHFVGESGPEMAPVDAPVSETRPLKGGRNRRA